MKKYKIYQSFFKRPLDLFVSIVGIIVLMPLIIIIAFLVRLLLGSPIIFVQERPGLDEKVFKLYKFRTMNNKRDINGRLLPDEKRLTKFGIFLRSTSIDELPSLFNILIGNMSLVGPRPLLVEYLPLYDENQRKRHNVKPGLTGLAQVNGRNSIDWNKKFDFDIKYIERITFVGDMRIILKTFLKVFKRSNINSDSSATMETFTGKKE